MHSRQKRIVSPSAKHHQMWRRSLSWTRNGARIDDLYELQDTIHDGGEQSMLHVAVDRKTRKKVPTQSATISAIRDIVFRGCRLLRAANLNPNAFSSTRICLFGGCSPNRDQKVSRWSVSCRPRRCCKKENGKIKWSMFGCIKWAAKLLKSPSDSDCCIQFVMHHMLLQNYVSVSDLLDLSVL